METECSLPCSQVSYAGPCPEPSMTPRTISLRSFLISFTRPSRCLPSGLFPYGFPTNILHAFLFSPIRATCTVHLIFLDLIILIILGEGYKLLISSLCSFLQPPLNSSLSGPNIPLSTLFSNILSLYSSLNIRAQVSHTYETKTKLQSCIF
jgi:hypothetical protein